jgi:hypothetical protein
MQDLDTMSTPARNLIAALRELGGDTQGVKLSELTQRAAQTYVGLEVEGALEECLTAGWIEMSEPSEDEEPRVTLVGEARSVS